MADPDSAFLWETEALRATPPPRPPDRESSPDKPTATTSESPSEDNPPNPIPPGTMLVPLDAWNKMVMQLGNLHEAGQQLANARERAAKAETEVRFLKERLAELRAKAEEARAAAEAERQPTTLVGRLYRAWRRR